MVGRYRKAAVGGTFDQLHKGHVRLIGKALEVGDSVVIGLTTDEMLKADPKSHFVARFDERRRELLSFLASIGALGRVKMVPLNDPYGPAVDDEEVDALVVSHETYGRGEEINEIRRKKGFKPLKLIVIDDVLAEDGLPISTTRIRRGEIDREGRLLPSGRRR